MFIHEGLIQELVFINLIRTILYFIIMYCIKVPLFIIMDGQFVNSLSHY